MIPPWCGNAARGGGSCSFRRIEAQCRGRIGLQAAKDDAFDGRILVALPGSEAAVRLAMEKLLLPELGHLVQQATK